MTAAGKCPLCGKSTLTAAAPFCSQGCKDRDLLNWLGETYRVPVSDDSTERETGLDSDPEG